MTFSDTLRDLLRQSSWLEVVANTVNLVSIIFATRNSVHTWWTGIAGCSLFAWLFFDSRLYADVTLQLFFITTSGIGWWHWLHHQGKRIERPITRTGRREWVFTLPVAVLVTVGYGWLLHRFTNAYAPFIDSAVLTLSIVAQILLMRRELETWIFWFAANSIIVPLFASRGLWLTSLFYLLFWFNASVGFLRWRREWRASLAPAQ